ncbi:MAG: FAD-dependent oxidoreductase [Gemmatimonadota bacterium]
MAARVCPHPCEREVNSLGWPQGARRAEEHPSLVDRFPAADRDDRISVRAVERWLGDLALERPPEGLGPVEERDGEAAVVGSGPAGLSAAWTLRRAGWRVTVFESADEPGGMLRVGIPGFRLAREVLDGELARFRAIGVDFRCGVRVGEDVTLQELEARYGAVVLAVGHHRSRVVDLEGARSVGDAVVPGLTFLDRFNAGLRPEIGRRVAIVGGGNTAVDCARAAVRLGAEAVVVYRRTEEEMPAIPEEVDEARREGVRFLFQRQPVRVRARPDGGIAEIVTVAMRQGAAEADGRRRAETVGGSETGEPFDSVILAVGEAADLSLLDGTGIRSNGRISTNFTGATSRPGVFACGDAAFGHGTVTQAIATGRRTAELASQHLARREGRG